MSIYTTMNLLAGNDKIMAYYGNAKSIWESIWEKPESESVEGLANLLTNSQYLFENACGGQDLGYEVMTQAGFGMLYDESPNVENEIKMQRLIQAFKDSSCSNELIARAEETAKLYSF